MARSRPVIGDTEQRALLDETQSQLKQIQLANTNLVKTVGQLSALEARLEAFEAAMTICTVTRAAEATTRIVEVSPVRYSLPVGTRLLVYAGNRRRVLYLAEESPLGAKYLHFLDPGIPFDLPVGAQVAAAPMLSQDFRPQLLALQEGLQTVQTDVGVFASDYRQTLTELVSYKAEILNWRTETGRQIETLESTIQQTARQIMLEVRRLVTDEATNRILEMGTQLSLTADQIRNVAWRVGKVEGGVEELRTGLTQTATRIELLAERVTETYGAATEHRSTLAVMADQITAMVEFQSVTSDTILQQSARLDITASMIAQTVTSETSQALAGTQTIATLHAPFEAVHTTLQLSTLPYPLLNGDKLVLISGVGESPRRIRTATVTLTANSPAPSQSPVVLQINPSAVPSDFSAPVGSAVYIRSELLQSIRIQTATEIREVVRETQQPAVIAATAVPLSGTLTAIPVATTYTALTGGAQLLIYDDTNGVYHAVTVNSESTIAAGVTLIPIESYTFTTEVPTGSQVLTRVYNMYSLIQQNADSILLKVNRTDILNESETSIQLKPELIYISGTTQFAPDFGRGRVFRAASAPQGTSDNLLVEGDLWYDTGAGDMPYSFTTAAGVAGSVPGLIGTPGDPAPAGSWVPSYTRISGARITTGQIKSANWVLNEQNQTALGSMFDLANGQLYIGGNIQPRFAYNGTNVVMYGADLYIYDTQQTPKLRVQLGRLGEATTTYGLKVFDQEGKVVFNSAGTADSTTGVQISTEIGALKVTNILQIAEGGQIWTDAGRLVLNNSLLTVKDAQNTERVRIGNLTGGEYGMKVYNAAGTIIFDSGNATAGTSFLDQLQIKDLTLVGSLTATATRVVEGQPVPAFTMVLTAASLAATAHSLGNNEYAFPLSWVDGAAGGALLGRIGGQKLVYTPPWSAQPITRNQFVIEANYLLSAASEVETLASIVRFGAPFTLWESRWTDAQNNQEQRFVALDLMDAANANKPRLWSTQDLLIQGGQTLTLSPIQPTGVLNLNAGSSGQVRIAAPTVQDVTINNKPISPYDIAVWRPGEVVGGELILVFNCPRALKLTGIAVSGSGWTATTALSFSHGGVIFWKDDPAQGSSIQAAITSPDVSAGGSISIQAPTPSNGLRDVAITISGYWV